MSSIHRKSNKGAVLQEKSKRTTKTHSLTFLIDAIELELPPAMHLFVMKLTTVSVPARYPEQLREMQKVYNRKKTKSFLTQSKEVLEWLKKQL